MHSKNKILKAKIYHKRFSPKQYDFLHNGLFLFLDLDDLDKLSQIKLFSLNKFNIFSILFKEYGYRKFTNPKEYILEILEENNIPKSKIDKIYLLTMPSIMGYIFNPVSFWLCFNKENEMIISIAEVNNTFNERHSYICHNENFTKITSKDAIHKNKLFHVSPFLKSKDIINFNLILMKIKYESA
ncbi:MAG UNVERIFIED_CONTAM: DUF1365 domain-containing protein [Rickettsiaceae bacterium]|jgi:DUF1365 family protein